MSFRSRKGFTLVELVIAMLIILTAIPAVVNLYTSLVVEQSKLDSRDFSDIARLQEDMTFNSSLAKSISVSGNGSSVSILRFDDCIVSYDYDSNRERIKKSVNDKCSDQRALIVGDVAEFEATDEGGGIYDVKIRKTGMDEKKKKMKFDFKISILQ